jgi:hypothetical protein
MHGDILGKRWWTLKGKGRLNAVHMFQCVGTRFARVLTCAQHPCDRYSACDGDEKIPAAGGKQGWEQVKPYVKSVVESAPRIASAKLAAAAGDILLPTTNC